MMSAYRGRPEVIVHPQNDANDPTETSSANSNSGASTGMSHSSWLSSYRWCAFVDFTALSGIDALVPAARDTSLSAIVDPSALRAMTIQPNLIAL